MSETPGQPSVSEDEGRKIDVGWLPVLITNPDLVKQILEDMVTNGNKALLLTGTANATIPDKILPTVHTITQGGTPVFVMADQGGHGPDHAKYEGHAAIMDAGGTILRDVDAERGAEVLNAIQDGIEQGLAGPDLAQAITEIYGTPEPHIHPTSPPA